ncbi:hypothetical protein PIB30_058047 [Stylosanthes scabra]|uniref:Uncharacterized protein n=1 Tax=Stylosanthes scabra TaxID=79078 RepID=A0ABU6WI54_9FABA|nr:hypothetical protein [Stylosanthes scabra]
MLLRLTVQRNEPASYLKGNNDHPVPPSIRFLCFTELSLVTGSSPCLFGVPRVLCATCSSQRNMAALDEPKSTTFDSGEPYLGLILSNRRVRELNRRMSSWPALGTCMHHIDRLVALVILRTGNLRFSPPSSYTTQDFFSLSPLLHDETYRTVFSMSGCSPSSSTFSSSTGSVHRERERSPRTPLPPMALASAPGHVYPIPRTPMSDARCYRNLFPRHRMAPPTPPPPSPPSSDDEPSDETYDPATELVGDPDEPYVAEHVPYGAPEVYYSDVSYGSERESASTDSAPSSHHSSGSSSGSVSLGYGSASSESASDGASDDDLVNRYFAETFPPP